MSRQHPQSGSSLSKATYKRKPLTDQELAEIRAAEEARKAEFIERQAKEKVRKAELIEIYEGLAPGPKPISWRKPLTDQELAEIQAREKVLEAEMQTQAYWDRLLERKRR